MNEQRCAATLFGRVRGFIESDRALTVAASVSGFLCLAPSILAATGIDSLLSDKSKAIAVPLVLIPAAVALGVYFGKSTNG